jgi:hypothetical protein
MLSLKNPPKALNEEVTLYVEIKLNLIKIKRLSKKN